MRRGSAFTRRDNRPSALLVHVLQPLHCKCTPIGFDPSSFARVGSDPRLDKPGVPVDDKSGTLELVVLYGSPGCGKSSFCANHLPAHARVNQVRSGKL